MIAFKLDDLERILPEIRKAAEEAATADEVGGARDTFVVLSAEEYARLRGREVYTIDTMPESVLREILEGLERALTELDLDQ